MNMLRKVLSRRARIFAVSLAAAALGFPADAPAQSGRFYVGVAADADYLRVKYAKTVENADVASLPKRGVTYRDSDSVGKAAFGGGLLAGYRLGLGKGGFYVSAEADGQLHARSASGAFSGKGESQGRNQLGESWPDRWNLKRKYSYGATIRVGGPAEFLGSGSSVYVLGGARRLKTRLKVDYFGCLNPPDTSVLCRPDQFQGGSYSRDRSFWGWTAGAGMEKMLGDRVGVRGEVRHTRYSKLRRTPFSLVDGNLNVRTTLEPCETDFSLSAVVYF